MQHPQENLKYGYKIGEEKLITLPYADDFCLMTTDKRTHQRLLNQIAENVNSLGMKIKPSKCRSFTISGGKPSVVHYSVEGYQIPSISEEEQKFLGRVLFFEGKSQQTYELLEKTIKEKLDNLEQTAIRPEYKLEVYQMYILPSIR